VADKPILFSGWKVRAIYAGADVTRRLMNPQPPVDAETCHHNSYSGPEGPAWWWFKGTGDGERLCCWPKPGKPVEPRYRKGDILYVKEAWRVTEEYDHLPPRDIPRDAVIEYLATDVPFVLGRYRHARFMREWMTRLWVRVTEEPYPERVRDITEAEAIREGCSPGDCLRSASIHTASSCRLSNTRPTWHQDATGDFRCLWDSIHGPDSWERDWVWRIAIERTEAPHG